MRSSRSASSTISAQHRRRERVVHGAERAVLVGDVGQRVDVVDVHQRVRRRLDPEEFGVRLHRVPDGVVVGGVDEVERQVVLLVHLREDAVGAAVHVVAGDDVVAGLEQVEHGVDRAHPGGERAAELAALERGEVRFEVGPGGVSRPGVLVAAVVARRVLLVR